MYEMQCEHILQDTLGAAKEKKLLVLLSLHNALTSLVTAAKVSERTPDFSLYQIQKTSESKTIAPALQQHSHQLDNSRDVVI